MKNNRITIFGIKKDIKETTSKNDFWKFEECIIDIEKDEITKEQKQKLYKLIDEKGYIITREYLPVTILDKPNFINTITI